MESQEQQRLRRIEVAMTSVAQVDPATVDDRVAHGTVVIDVRDAQAHAEGRIPGSMHIEAAAIAQRIAESVPDLSTPILCYCNGGSRGPLAALALKELGYRDVGSVAGGLRAYVAQKPQ